MKSLSAALLDLDSSCVAAMHSAVEENKVDIIAKLAELREWIRANTSVTILNGIEKDLINEGKKIEAIKNLRARNPDMLLKDAADIVQHYIDNNGY